MESRQLVLAAFIALSAVFSLAANAQDAFIAAFDWRMAKLKAKGLQHPRSFPAGEETDGIFAAARTGDRRIGFAALTARLDKGAYTANAGIRIATARSELAANQKAMLGLAVKNAVHKDARTAQEAGFAALVTGSEAYRREAMRIMLALAALDPSADTSVASEDLSAMLIARTLALGLDWFPTYWTAAERLQLTQAISARMEDFALKLIRGPKPLEQNPLVSHDNEVLGALAEVAVLLVGDVPLADRWFDEFVPLYARLLTPFGGADGGYANGTAYASWDVGDYSLPHWDTLRRAIGLDLAKKAWSQYFGRYQAYFLPPGTPVGVFGDGAEAELRETWARHAKAYAYHVPTPLNRWYASQWFQEDPSRLELLTSPVMSSGAAIFPAGTPNAAVFPSIGWVALHSSLQDRSRTSLYFKSSPYGAVSHSHSDQNSFVLTAGGRQLLIDSGYYDYFGSPHHFGWTKRTIAHNAVTFDGGIGQEDPARPWGDESAKGKVVQFSTSPEIDLTVGDATVAYGGRLKRADRGIAYLRPNVFVIFDSLESAQPRRWEWNIHALDRFVQNAADSIEVVNADAKACIHFRSSTPTTFQQTNAFSNLPIRSTVELRPDQWHGQFVAKAPQAQFQSVAIVSMNCLAIDQEVQFKGASITVLVDGHELAYDGKRILIKKY